MRGRERGSIRKRTEMDDKGNYNRRIRRKEVEKKKHHAKKKRYGYTPKDLS